MGASTTASRWTTLILVAILVSTAIAPALAAGSQASTTRLVVGFHEYPAGLVEGGTHDGALVVRALPALRAAAVLTVDAARYAQRQAADPNVRYVENDDPRPLLLDAPARAEHPPAAQFAPDDPQYPALYGPQQVRVDLAWDTTLGTMDAAVCVLDTGVRLSHEDLGTARYLGGYDFVHGDADPADDHGHGTHVAGTAVGTIHNGKGIAGMANTAYYAVKVLDAGGSGAWSDLAAGIQWCADQTVPRTVLSLSLGGTGGATVLSDAVHHAFAVKGKLVVAASGNSGCSNCVLYPAAYPEAIAVSCTTSAQASCAFTSKGPQVDIAAPGNGILSTCYQNDTSYCTKSGTSMSTPHASGILALAWSNETALSAPALWQRLNESAQDLGAPGLDPVFGWGRIDALCLVTNTVCNVPPPPPPPTEDIFDEPFAPGASEWTLTGLWHTSSCRSTSPSTSLAYKKAGACSSNYDTGTTNGGSATSPHILIPEGATYVRLRFSSWYRTETSSSYDLKAVQVSANAGPFMEVAMEAGPAATWNAHDINLSTYAGALVQLRFRFDTVDALYNDHEGWYIDDVRIATDVPPGPPTAPYPPRAIGTAGPGAGSVHLTWTRPYSGGSPITSYHVHRADASTGPYTLLATTPSLQFTDTGLAPNTTRHYVMSAVNDVGESNWSASVSATTFSPPDAPPSLAAIGGPGRGQLKLTWPAPWGGGAPALSYTIHRATSAAGPFAPHASAATPSYTDTNLSDDTSYWYRVAAVTVVGEGPASPTATARTFARPGTPTGLDARPGGQLFSTELTWNAPANTGGTTIASYRIYRDGTYVGNATATSYLDTNLDPLRVYTYRITATNIVGESSKGDEVCSRASPWPSMFEGVCFLGLPTDQMARPNAPSFAGDLLSPAPPAPRSAFGLADDDEVRGVGFEPTMA